MVDSQERQLNQAAYRRLSELIRANYADGDYVAISGGEIVADARSFGELNDVLRKKSLDTPDVLVIQAGVDYPESVTIFLT